MATMTLTIDDTHVARIQAAFGVILGLGGDATAEDVRQYLIEHLKDRVRQTEMQMQTPGNVTVT